MNYSSNISMNDRPGRASVAIILRCIGHGVAPIAYLGWKEKRL